MFDSVGSVKSHAGRRIIVVDQRAVQRGAADRRPGVAGRIGIAVAGIAGNSRGWLSHIRGSNHRLLCPAELTVYT